MALLDLQGMEPSAPGNHGGHGGHASSASLLICVASSLSLVTCL
ncbi:SapB/AmfS family lanthipeptide [Rugosimonospora africana]|uniref:AmfS protein n=1 Tax=Rugosimonospora africana TaxID=556532 RepID=A0A8J3QRX3_9ACTN|nr:SapB/AmfS family lanthipeptide [Rugosimonospora africana]GIH14001.1 hypothetical protein Raf01_21730 [Rugosimonospora africana]